jgi:hypothetical protein
MVIRLEPAVESFLIQIYKAEKENPNASYIDTNDLERDQAERNQKVEFLKAQGFIDIETPFKSRTIGARYVKITSLGQQYCEKILYKDF